MTVDLTQFGRYRLIRRINLGGMAEVFKAKSYDPVAFEKIVALKRLLPTVAENPGFVDMFLQEAKIVARLRHPNICPIFELGQVGESYYITMEFIYGHDLRQVFKASHAQQRPIDPWLIAWIGEQVAEGLDYAYNRAHNDQETLGVVHRDISPQNIMIGFDGTVKIIDFGIAKAAISTVQTAAGVLKGKYAYMSPEQASGRPLDHRSDIWSLGVVLYELLSGRRLFVGEAATDIIEQVQHWPIEPLKDVPKPISDVVHAMIERSFDSRIGSHGEVRDRLKDVF